MKLTKFPLKCKEQRFWIFLKSNLHDFWPYWNVNQGVCGKCITWVLLRPHNVPEYWIDIAKSIQMFAVWLIKSQITRGWVNNHDNRQYLFYIQTNKILRRCYTYQEPFQKTELVYDVIHIQSLLSISFI